MNTTKTRWGLSIWVAVIFGSSCLILAISVGVYYRIWDVHHFWHPEDTLKNAGTGHELPVLPQHLTVINMTDSVRVQKTEYHIRVECYGSMFCVRFTNDNWITEDKLMTAFDNSQQGYDGLTHQIWLTKSKEEAIQFAKLFKEYNDCIAYNSEMEEKFRKLKAYREAHPFCTGPINIY